MRQIKDFVGFRFGNVHSSELNLLVVSSSDRYEKNLLPDPTDYTTEIPGSDGTYYFGQTYKDRTFTVNVAFDRVSEPIFRKIS
jgi:phage-related protein